MSDDLRDAMSRAVDRLAPFPPNADALKAAAKRSRYRRHIIGGWIGFIILSTFSTWLFIDSEPSDPSPRPARRDPVAAPVSWDNPEIAAKIDLPGRPASIDSDGDNVWVGLENGNLVRVDPATNEIAQEIDVGGGIIEIAADDDIVWAAATPEGTEPSGSFGGPTVEDIFRVDTAAGEVSPAVELRSPSNVRMTADDGKLFYLDGTNSTDVGQVFGYDATTGEITDYKWSASSLAIWDDVLWLGSGKALVKVDPSKGTSEDDEQRILDLEQRVRELCMDCPPPDRGIVVSDEYIVHAANGLVVYERLGEWLQQIPLENPAFGASLAIDGNTLFVWLTGGRVGVFDLSSGERDHVVDGLGPYVSQMTVAAGSLWVEDEKNGQIVRISDRPEPAPVASGEPNDKPGPGDGRCCTRTSYKDEDLGFTVSYPVDWHRAEGPMTKARNPKEILTLGTMPMNLEGDEMGDCAPNGPLSRLGETGALIHVTENESPSLEEFPSLPAELGLDDLSGPAYAYCWSHAVSGRGFRQNGRKFVISVVLGEEITPERRAEVSDVLDSLHFDSLNSKG